MIFPPPNSTVTVKHRGTKKKKKKRTETGIYTRSSPCTSCNTSHSWGKLKGREEHPAGVAAGVLCITML